MASVVGPVSKSLSYSCTSAVLGGDFQSSSFLPLSWSLLPPPDLHGPRKNGVWH